MHGKLHGTSMLHRLAMKLGCANAVDTECHKGIENIASGRSIVIVIIYLRHSIAISNNICGAIALSATN